MSDSPSQTRPAARTIPKQPSATTTTGVALESDAHSLLKRGARKFDLHEKTFASAAIRYVVLNGLDPTKLGGLAEGVQTRAEISEASHAIRQAVAELASQLTAFRQEMHQLQAQTLGRLEEVEANVQAHQTALEVQLLVPLVQRTVTLNVEAHLSAQLLELLLLKLADFPHSVEELKARTDAHSLRVTAGAAAHLQVVQHAARLAQEKLTRQPLPAKSTLAVALANAKPADATQSEVP